MDYQYALNMMMEREQLKISDVAANTGWSIKYAQEIAANRRWHPYFDSVLKLCYRLRFNVFTFFEFAEAGVRGQHPTPNTQHPTPNTQDSRLRLGSRFQDSIVSSQYQGCESFVENLEVQRSLILLMEPLHVAQAFRSWRIERGLSQKELGILTSFSVQTISLRESSRYASFPSMASVEYYCSAFEISLCSFLRSVFRSVVTSSPSHYW